DNGLTRTFVPKNQIVGGLGKPPGISYEKISLTQPVTNGGRQIYGPLGRVDPFDKYGRRIIEVDTVQGLHQVIQGITEISSKVTKLEALRGYQWYMRIATSSIPREQL